MLIIAEFFRDPCTMPRAADPTDLPTINRARQVMATNSDMDELIRLSA